MHEAFGIITRNLRTAIGPRSRVRNDILVSSLDDSPAKAGLTYCRLFSTENRISAQSVQTLDMLDRTLRGTREIQRLVFIDDFAGTGQTLVQGLQRNLDLLRFANSRGVRIVLIALAGFGQSRDYIQDFVKRNSLDADVYFCDELGPEDKAFAEASSVFTDAAELNRAKQVAESKGIILEKKYPLGYKDTQALIVFYLGCPNNSLPILWSQNSSWSPLFPRR